MQSYFIEWIKDHTWSIEVLGVLAFLLALNFSFKKALAAAKRDERGWLIHLDYAAVTPVRVLLWVLLVSFLVDLIAREAGFAFSVALIRNVAIVLCLAWFLLRWKTVAHRAMVHHRKSYDPLSMQIAGRLFTIAVVFLSLLIILQLFGLDIGPLIAFGGIGAAALGFASKDVIANFFGGVMLSMTRPFTVGDLIELPEKKVVGYIEEIGWYLTSVRDLQKKPIYVPNWLFSTELIVNQSRMTHRRIEETIGIRYEDIGKVLEIVEGIRTLLKKHISIDNREASYIFLQRLAPATVDIEVKAYVIPTRYEEFMEVRQEVLMEIYRIVTGLGAEMPLPTSQVVLREG